jgi:hypothetical protein
MKRLVSRLLIVTTLFLATTFAGMAFFGMESAAMPMGGHACLGAACETAPAADAADCVDHCLSSVSPAVTLPLATALGSVLLAFFAVVLLTEVFAPSSPAPEAWRRGIGKALRHSSLSTIVLRN